MVAAARGSRVSGRRKTQRGLRVAFDARYVRDAYGGIARFAYCLLGALTRTESEATFVVYYDPRQPATRFPLAGLFGRDNVVARATRLPLYSPQEQVAWPLLLARDDVDLYYSPYFALPLLAPRPLVNTVHDLIFEQIPAYAGGRWVRGYYRPMMRLALRRAAKVVAVSDWTKGELLSYYRLAPAKVVVVPEAAAAGFRHPLDEHWLADVRRRLGLPERYVLAIGARRPHKNLGAAVRAFAQVQGEVPHTLVIVGRAEPRYRDDVAAALRELGRGVRVRELSTVAEDDLPGLYALADVLLMPSLYEGFGLPALEAMACGTPVIAADRTSLPAVVGEAGVLVDVTAPGALAAALRQVLGDEHWRQELRQRGLVRAAAFSWERSAAALLEVFRQAAGK